MKKFLQKYEIKIIYTLSGLSVILAFLAILFYSQGIYFSYIVSLVIPFLGKEVKNLKLKLSLFGFLTIVVSLMGFYSGLLGMMPREENLIELTTFENYALQIGDALFPIFVTTIMFYCLFIIIKDLGNRFRVFNFFFKLLGKRTNISISSTFEKEYIEDIEANFEELKEEILADKSLNKVQKKLQILIQHLGIRYFKAVLKFQQWYQNKLG